MGPIEYSRREKLTVREDVSDYFKSVAETRASLEGLGVISWVTLGILILDFFFLRSFIDGSIETQASSSTFPAAKPWYIAHCVTLAFSLILALLSHLHQVVYAHQALFSSLFAIEGAVMTYSVCLMGLAIFVSESSAPGSYESLLAQTIHGLLIWALVLSIAIIFYIVLLVLILKRGIPQKFSVQNYVGVDLTNSTKVAVIILGFSVFCGLIGQSGYFTFEGVMGLSLLIFFSLIIPVVPFEFGTLAYLKWRDHSFWEDPPEPIPFWTDERKARWKKRGVIIGICTVIFFILMAIARYHNLGHVF